MSGGIIIFSIFYYISNKFINIKNAALKVTAGFALVYEKYLKIINEVDMKKSLYQSYTILVKIKMNLYLQLH